MIRAFIAAALIALNLSAPPALAVSSGQKNMKGSVSSLLQPNRSPLVTFRILFMTGSAFDPQGKEGVAALTAALLAEGGTRAMSYEQITEAMYPMATFFGWQIDKEMTVFTGTTHVDNLDLLLEERRQRFRRVRRLA